MNALELGGDVVGGHDPQNLTVEAEDQRALGLAQPDRILGQRLEDRLEVERGPADHLEQLAGRRLLLQRHPQLAVARLQLLEQPHVLDGDDGLVGEGLSSAICLSVNGPRSRAPTPIAPIGPPSRSMGTASMRRMPTGLPRAVTVYSRIASAMSAMCTTCRVEDRAARTRARRLSGTGNPPEAASTSASRRRRPPAELSPSTGTRR